MRTASQRYLYTVHMPKPTSGEEILLFIIPNIWFRFCEKPLILLNILIAYIFHVLTLFLVYISN
jgi:hypothetical protein